MNSEEREIANTLDGLDSLESPPHRERTESRREDGTAAAVRPEDCERITRSLLECASELKTDFNRETAITPRAPFHGTAGQLRETMPADFIRVAVACNPADRNGALAGIAIGRGQAVEIATLIDGAPPADDERMSETIRDFAFTLVNRALPLLLGSPTPPPAIGPVQENIDHTVEIIIAPCEIRFDAAGTLPFFFFIEPSLLQDNGGLATFDQDSINAIPYAHNEPTGAGAQPLPAPAPSRPQRPASVHLRVFDMVRAGGVTSTWKARRAARKLLSSLTGDEKRALTGVADVPQAGRPALDALLCMIKEEIARHKKGIINMEFLVPELAQLPELPLPLAVRFDGGAFRPGETPSIADASHQPIERYLGCRGELLFAGKTIAHATLRRSEREGLHLEIDTQPAPRTGAEIAAIALDHMAPLSVEIGRVVLDAGEAASLREGSVIAFNRLAGEPLSVMYGASDITLFSGEIVTIENDYGSKNFAVRVTDVARRMDNPKVLPMFTKRPRTPGAPSLTARFLLGTTSVPLKDLICFGEGSLIELDRKIDEPAWLEFSDGSIVSVETIIQDELFAARITSGQSGATAETCAAASDECFLPEEESPEGNPGPAIEDMPAGGAEDTFAPDAFDEFHALIETMRQSIERDDSGRDIERELNELIDVDPGKTARALARWIESEPQRAAAFLVATGDERAAKLVSLTPDELLGTITFELSRAGDVLPSRKRELVVEALARIHALDAVSSGGVDYARKVLERAVGEQRAIDIVNRLTASLVALPFDFIRRADPEQLRNIICDEHPQVIALVLAHLDPSMSAQILSGLSHQIQAIVAMRIAIMGRTSPGVIREVERVLERRLSTLDGGDFMTAGGIDALVEVLTNVDRGTEKMIIEALEEEEQELAEEIKKRMFVFEDIVLLDDLSIQKVLREVDTRDLARALKWADAEAQEKFFRNMSERASSLLRADINFMGPTVLRDVEEAQQKIVNIIRKLEEAGDIIIARAGDNELVV